VKNLVRRRRRQKQKGDEIIPSSTHYFLLAPLLFTRLAVISINLPWLLLNWLDH